MSAHFSVTEMFAIGTCMTISVSVEISRQELDKSYR